MTLLRIANGTVYDPANGIDGAVRDIWIPAYDEERVHDIQKWFESFYTIQFANYPVDSGYMAHGGTAVECRPQR